MSRLVKIGLIGMGVTTSISLLLFFVASVSFRTLSPFYMPWAVLLLIGFTNKKNKNQ